MKKVLLFCSLLVMLAACQNKSQQTESKPPTDSVATSQTEVKTDTLVFEGKLKETAWGDKNAIQWITLHNIIGSEDKGTFELVTDYDNTKTHEGKPVEDLIDSGSFDVVQDPKWGTVFELAGPKTGTAYYQAIQAKLKKLDHEKKGYTGVELADISASVNAFTQAGTDSKEHGCKASAGYTWSFIKKDCVRLWEVGTLLEPVEGTPYTTQAAVLIFDKNREYAELFLPGETEAHLLKQTGTSKWQLANLELTLQTGLTLVLKQNDKVVYQGSDKANK